MNEMLDAMTGRYWKLDGHTPVPATLREWGQMYDEDERQVASDEVGEWFVSTVFLGADPHFYFHDPGPPQLFETMIFWHGDGPNDDDEMTWRYATWDEAAAKHAEIVEALRSGGELPA